MRGRKTGVQMDVELINQVVETKALQMLLRTIGLMNKQFRKGP